MDFDLKERLAMTGDASELASGRRIRAARLFTSLSQEELANHAGTKKQAISNIENGRAYPKRPVMIYFFREHRIDFNFLVFGQFSQLPLDVQERLFDVLQAESTERDRKTN